MPDPITPTPSSPQFVTAETLKVAAIMARFDRRQLAAFVTVAIDLFDAQDGDPEAEANGDELDQSYPEAAGPRGHVIAGRASAIEDAELDDADSGSDEAEPDFSRPSPVDRGAGCPIADPGGCEHDGREPDHDAEIKQMAADVPCLPVFALEPNIFTGKRELLGMGNLPPSFRGTGVPTKVAD